MSAALVQSPTGERDASRRGHAEWRILQDADDVASPARHPRRRLERRSDVPPASTSLAIEGTTHIVDP
jgi:hypothetical protein